MYRQPPQRRSKHRLIVVVLLVVLIAATILAWRSMHGRNADSQPPATGAGASTGQEPAASNAFNKKAHSLTDPASIWVIVNKQRPLNPTTYIPEALVTPMVPLRLGKGAEEMLLRKDAAEALERMVDKAKAEGLELMLASGYRSYTSQQKLYEYYVQHQGRAAADTQSARPGHSEHQTGLAADLAPASRECEVEACFANTPEGKWLAAHAHEYGYVIRYMEGTQGTTGYIYEPWHIRYVGSELAHQIHAVNGQALENFFGLEKAGNY